MKKFLIVLFLLFAINLPSLAYEFTPVECAPMKAFLKSFKGEISSNITYNGKSTSAVVSFKMNTKGKISDIKILKSGGFAYDRAIMRAFSTMHKQRNNLAGYIFNKDVYFVGYFSSDESKVAYLSDYSKKLNLEASKIGKNLFEWNYFATDPFIVYLSTNELGEAKEAKIIQSTGVKSFDKTYTQELKRHKFSKPNDSATVNDLWAPVVCRPLNNELEYLFKKYLFEAAATLAKNSPKDKNVSCVKIRLTVDKEGKIKEMKLIEKINSKEYKASLSKGLHSVNLSPFPKKIDLDEITFIYILNPTNQTWKVQTYPEYIYF